MKNMHPFFTPVDKSIGGISFQVAKIPFEAFDAAITFGSWLLQRGGLSFNLEDLDHLRSGTAEREAFERLLTASFSHEQDGQRRQLSSSDIQAMPIPMVLHAAYVVIEENLEYFLQTLSALQPIQTRLMSSGSQLLSSSSRPGATATATEKSVAT